MEKQKVTAEERLVWGKCPVCGASQGKACKDTDATGRMARMMDGAHLGRLQQAPEVVDATAVKAPAAKPAAKAATRAPAKRKKATA